MHEKNNRIQNVLEIYKPYKKTFTFVMICSLIAMAAQLVRPLIVGYITNDLLKNVTQNNNNLLFEQILKTGFILISVIIVEATIFFFLDTKGHVMGAKMETDMRNKIFSHYQTMSFGFFDNTKTGDILSKIVNDTEELAEFFHHAPEDFILYNIKFVVALIILFNINFKLTLIITLILPILFVFAYFYNKKMMKVYKKSRENISQINSQISETMSSIREVQSYTKEDFEAKKFGIANNKFFRSRKKIYVNEAVLYGGVEFSINLITAIVVIYSAISILSETMVISELLVFMLYIGYITDPIRRIMWTVGQYQRAFAGLKRYFEAFDTVPEISSKNGAVVPEKIIGNVRFEDISFSYNDKTKVINNLSLDVASGEYIAIVGASGVGKTTLCSLIPRFYEVDFGEVYVDNINVKDMDLKSLRESIGVVSQDTYLFSGSIYDNIKYGDENATEEQIKDAARKACADDFIENLEDGYNTIVGERGVKLSGGQKQRVSVARAFLKNPNILILDEATSSLDYESEKALQKSFDDLSKNRTTLVIAHRLSTIRNAEKIVVLRDGNIEMIGKHEDLILKDGTYKDLYSSQIIA